MNNHAHHNNEQRPDENPFGCILKRALLHRDDESHRYSAASISYSGVSDHNRARINLARTGMRCQEMRS